MMNNTLSKVNLSLEERTKKSKNVKGTAGKKAFHRKVADKQTDGKTTTNTGNAHAVAKPKPKSIGAVKKPMALSAVKSCLVQKTVQKRPTKVVKSLKSQPTKKPTALSQTRDANSVAIASNKVQDEKKPKPPAKRVMKSIPTMTTVAASSNRTAADGTKKSTAARLGEKRPTKVKRVLRKKIKSFKSKTVDSSMQAVQKVLPIMTKPFVSKQTADIL